MPAKRDLVFRITPLSPLPELPYERAPPPIRAVYDAIAQALGVRLVNLVYRHLATVPGALEWAWATVGDDFRSGTFRRHAKALTVLSLETELPHSEAVSLSRCGPDDAASAAIVETLEAYNRANPMNAVSLQVIALALEGSRPAKPFVAPAADASGLPALLPIAPLEGLPAGTAALLERLARQATGRDTTIVPSLFRHLSPWPGLLEALSEWLAPVAEGGEIDRLSARIYTAAEDLARTVYEELPTENGSRFVPGAETRAALVRTVTVFPPAICRMIVIGGLLRTALRP